ncbi:hypothetical protein FORC83_p046 (plasmid) [Campylobacter jejuni]|nr:hypothetical protein FORC83_p046 [Campylobacter jejuni]
MVFNHRIDTFLKENNIKVVFLDDLNGKGLYIPKERTIILKSELSKEEQILVLLHEIGHLINDENVPGSYNKHYVPRSKMENKANDFMLRELLYSYLLTTGAEPTDINCVAFLECEKLPLSLENDVKRILSENTVKIGIY